MIYILFHFELLYDEIAVTQFLNRPVNTYINTYYLNTLQLEFKGSNIVCVICSNLFSNFHNLFGVSIHGTPMPFFFYRILER